MKKIIRVSLVLLLSLCIVTGCGKKKTNTNEPPVIDNNEPAIKEDIKLNYDATGDQMVEELKIENVDLFYESGTTYYKAWVVNTLEVETDFSKLKIHLMKGDEEIATLPGRIASAIAPGGRAAIATQKAGDYSDATSIVYEIIR